KSNKPSINSPMVGTFYQAPSPGAAPFVKVGSSVKKGDTIAIIIEIGSKQFIPGFEEGMVGMKSGEEKDVKVTFPKEYGAAHLAG
ncbi:FKBP-type peptidyl-prolyl cis-trans isomerase, partial [Campylobacter coli]|uniref:FKBP-type peptidyl-prolyl cis-trans isomerase n=1 Tax=Campylobacter coli TaxID=195 RepID=UPI002E36D831